MRIRILKTTDLGLEVYKIFADEVFIGQALSEQGANSMALQYYNKHSKGV